MSGWRSIAWIAAGPFALGSVAHAVTYTVNPDGTGDFPTIQETVDAAKKGDEIVLSSGYFGGPGNRGVLVSGKALVIRSSTGRPYDCILGGTILCFEAGLSLRNCVLCENEAQEAGPLFVQWSAFTAEDCLLMRNGATLYPGGAAMVVEMAATFTRAARWWGTGPLPDEREAGSRATGRRERRFR